MRVPPRLDAAAAAVIAAMALGLALAPLAWLLAQGPPALTGTRWLSLAGHSIGLATVVAVSAAALGTGAALGMAGRDGPLAKAARALFLLPLLLPPYAVAVAWGALLGRGGPLGFLGAALPGVSGLPGAALVLAGATAPLVTLFTLAALDDLDPRLVAAALVHGGPGRLWWRGVLPQVAPAVATGAAVAFCLALGEHAVPALVQLPVFATEIHAEVAATGDPAAAARLAWVLVLPAILVLGASQWLDRRRPLVGRHVAPGPGLPLPPWLARVASLCAAGVLVGVLAPPLGLGWWALRPEGLRVALDLVGRPLLDASLVGALAAILAVALAAPLASRLAVRPRAFLRLAVLVPLALPPSVHGLAALHLAHLPGLAPLTRTPLALAAAHAARLLPFAVVVLLLHLRRRDPRLSDVAALAPSRPHALLALATGLVPGLAAASAVVLALSLAELDASLVLAPPGRGSLSVTLFNLLHHGAGDAAAAATLIAMAVPWAAWALGGWALSWRRA